MKSYNHLWEEFISDDNIRLSITNSSRGKRDRKYVKEIYGNMDKWIPKIRKYAENFCNNFHTPKEIYDGISRKKRVIIVPSYKEQIIHHMAVNVLIPIFMHGMYEHSYGSIPSRGVHKGKKTVEKWIKNDRKNVKYCLKMDIKKYFDSIPHDILKMKFSKIIHDKKFLDLIYELVDVIDNGIPIGFYTSQWIANWYLRELDHYIKEKLHARYYIRYMDDMVIFGSNKRKLHYFKNEIEEYLEKNLGLHLKDNWQVFRFDYMKNGIHFGRFLDFMGFRFYRDKTTLRKSIMLKSTRKARKISKKGKPTIYDMRQMISYLGYIDCTNTYQMYKDRIKPYINFRIFKNKISRYDKNRMKEKKNDNLQKNRIHDQSGTN